MNNYSWSDLWVGWGTNVAYYDVWAQQTSTLGGWPGGTLRYVVPPSGEVKEVTVGEFGCVQVSMNDDPNVQGGQLMVVDYEELGEGLGRFRWGFGALWPWWLGGVGAGVSMWITAWGIRLFRAAAGVGGEM